MHKVRASLDLPELSKAGSSLQLDIFNADGKLGTLVIGQGSLRWTAKKKQKAMTKSWSAFAEWISKK